MKDILVQGLAQMGVTPPPGGVDKLCRYAELLLAQNRVMNLTAITEPEDVARLHFLDSAGVLLWNDSSPEGLPSSVGPLGRHLPPGGRLSGQSSWLAGKSVIDVGTGAGFPGLVLKILEPSLSLTLVDSTAKKVGWLGEVCKALDLDSVRCVTGRAEELAHDPAFRDTFDGAVSRAVAAYPALCELCLPLVRVGGMFLAMKGADAHRETQAGQNAVKALGGKGLDPFGYDLPGAQVTRWVLGARKVGPTPEGYPRSWGRVKKAPL